MNKLPSRRVKVRALAGCLTLTALVLTAPTTRSVAATVQARAGSNASSAYTQAAAEFSVFARPRTAGSALPSNSAYLGGITRRIAGSTQPFSVWGVLNGSRLCVTVHARSGPATSGPAACNSVSQLSKPGQLLVLGAGTGDSMTPQILAALVPDGVSSVTVSYTNGRKTVSPVKNNGFAIETGGLMPRSLRLSNGVTTANFAAANQSPAVSYTGEFCYGIALYYSETCVSNTVPNIRRAIGYGTYWTYVRVSGDGLSINADCTSDGCTADTGYLPVDVTGNGLIQNYGPCDTCTGEYYGWLYA